MRILEQNIRLPFLVSFFICFCLYLRALVPDSDLTTHISTDQTNDQIHNFKSSSMDSLSWILNPNILLILTTTFFYFILDEADEAEANYTSEESSFPSSTVSAPKFLFPSSDSASNPLHHALLGFTNTASVMIAVLVVSGCYRWALVTKAVKKSMANNQTLSPIQNLQSSQSSLTSLFVWPVLISLVATTLCAVFFFVYLLVVSQKPKTESSKNNVDYSSNYKNYSNHGVMGSQMFTGSDQIDGTQMGMPGGASIGVRKRAQHDYEGQWI